MRNGPTKYNVKPLIAALRMSGWTLKVLSEETRYSDSTLSRLFLHRGPVSNKAINAVADALRVSRDEVWK